MVSRSTGQIVGECRTTLRNGPQEGRLAAVGALFTLCGAAAIEPLTEALEDLDREVRAEAAAKLAEIDPGGMRELRDAARHGSALARPTAVGHLALEDDFDLITESLSDSSLAVRSAALTHLVARPHPDAVDALARCLEDPDGELQRTASIALALCGAVETVELLREKSRSSPEPVARTATAALVLLDPFGEESELARRRIWLDAGPGILGMNPPSVLDVDGFASYRLGLEHYPIASSHTSVALRTLSLLTTDRLNRSLQLVTSPETAKELRLHLGRIPLDGVGKWLHRLDELGGLSQVRAGFGRLLASGVWDREALSKVLEDQRDPAARRSAVIKELGAVADAGWIPTFGRLLRDPAWEVRRSAGSALLLLGKAAAPAAVPALRSADPRVRREAVRVLHGVGWTPANTEDRLLWDAAEGRWGDVISAWPRGIDLVKECLQSWEPESRLGAANEARAHRSPALFEILRKRVGRFRGERNPQVREALERAVRELEADGLRTRGLPIPSARPAADPTRLPLPAGPARRAAASPYAGRDRDPAPPAVGRGWCQRARSVLGTRGRVPRASLEEMPMAGLSTEQVGRFERDGYLALPGLIPEELRRAILEVFEELLERSRAMTANTGGFSLAPDESGRPIPGRLHKIQGVCVEDARVLELAGEPAILDCVESLIGPDIDVFGTKFYPMNVLGATSTGWHQDNHYFGTRSAQVVSCATYLHPTRVENGCLRVVPGSHRSGDLVQHRRGEGIYAHGSWTPVGEDEAVDLICSPGTVVLFSANLLHGARPNVTGEPSFRTAWHYIPGDLNLEMFTRGGYQDRHIVRGH